MIETLKKSFELCFRNSMLPAAFIFISVTIQVILMLILSQSAPTSISALISIVIAVALCVALFSGWLKLVKDVISPDDNEEEQSKWSVYFGGIGEKFLTNLKITIFYSALFMVSSIVAYAGLIKCFPSLFLTRDDIIAVVKQLETLTPATVIAPDSKLFIFVVLMSILNIALYIGTFLFSLLLADIYMNDESKFFKNLSCTVKFIRKNFLNVFAASVFLAVLYMAVSALNFLFQTNVFLSVLGIILSAYYASYYIIVVFLLYEQKKDKSNCDNGCNSDGQNEICD